MQLNIPIEDLGEPIDKKWKYYDITTPLPCIIESYSNRHRNGLGMSLITVTPQLLTSLK
jgi:hypothetical protein